MLLDKQILIRAPPDRVWGWLAPARQPSWDRSLLRAAAEGPLGPGARFGRVSREMGHRFEMRAEAVAWEPGRRFGWRQLAGDWARHGGTFHLEPHPLGTLVRLVADVDFPYVMPDLVREDELRRALSEEADEALFNLKALAEAGPGA